MGSKRATFILSPLQVSHASMSSSSSQHTSSSAQKDGDLRWGRSSTHRSSMSSAEFTEITEFMWQDRNANVARPEGQTFSEGRLYKHGETSWTTLNTLFFSFLGCCCVKVVLNAVFQFFFRGPEQPQSYSTGSKFQASQPLISTLLAIFSHSNSVLNLAQRNHVTSVVIPKVNMITVHDSANVWLYFPLYFLFTELCERQQTSDAA